MAIHVFDNDGREDGFEVWSNPEPGPNYAGRCVGTGLTREEAIADARKELESDLRALATAAVTKV